MNFETTIDMLTNLSVADRLRVVEAVWNSLESESAALPMSPSQHAELNRRLDDFEAHPDQLLTWDQVLDRLREKL